jgi:hypothetical protein
VTEAGIVVRRPRVWGLVSVQAVLVAAYAYGAVAYLATDAAYFPEQAPPGWSWPAVLVVAVGWLPALVCLGLAARSLARSDRRAEPVRWFALAIATGAAGAMLVTMATPPGWALFEWYVS